MFCGILDKETHNFISNLQFGFWISLPSLSLFGGSLLRLTHKCEWLHRAFDKADRTPSLLSHCCQDLADVTAVDLATHDPSCGWATRHNSDGSLKCGKPALSIAATKQTNHWKNGIKSQKCKWLQSPTQSSTQSPTQTPTQSSTHDVASLHRYNNTFINTDNHSVTSLRQHSHQHR